MLAIIRIAAVSGQFLVGYDFSKCSFSSFERFVDKCFEKKVMLGMGLETIGHFLVGNYLALARWRRKVRIGLKYALLLHKSRMRSPF